MQISLLAAVLLAVAASLQTDYPKPMYVTSVEAPVHTEGDQLSSIVTTLAAGDSLMALAPPSGGYIRVAVGDTTGYVLVANLTAVRPAALPDRGAESGSRAVRRRGQSDEGGVTGSSTRESASVQCSGTTKSGKRCSRMTTDASGRCWQHKK